MATALVSSILMRFQSELRKKPLRTCIGSERRPVSQTHFFEVLKD